MNCLKNIIYILAICLPVFVNAQAKKPNTKPAITKPANPKSATTKLPNWENELKNVLPKVLAIANRADEPVSKLIARRSGKDFATTINLPGSKLTYVSKGYTHWVNGKGYTWWTWNAKVDTAVKGTESDRLIQSFVRLKNELRTLYPANEKQASFKPEITAEYSFDNHVFLTANLIQGADYSGTSDYVQLYLTFRRESDVNYQKLVDSVKQNMMALVNNNQLTGKEIADKIIKEARILKSEQANPEIISELVVDIFSVAANKNMEIAFELYMQWMDEKELPKMKAKLSSSQSAQFKMMAQKVVDNHNNKSTTNTQTNATVEKKVEVPKYDPAKDVSCIFKAGAFLRYKDNLTRQHSNGLDAHVVSCKNGFYRIVTRKYVPGQKTWLTQNVNIPHYQLSESTADRGYVEKEFELNYDYKAGKKINVCTQCGGTGAEYYAERLVNGKSESVNVTRNMGSLNSNVITVKSSCSKCFGAGWKVQN